MADHFSDATDGDEGSSSAAADAMPHDSSPAERHADKRSDPRVAISGRGILLGLVVIVFGVLGAIGSIYARRTRLEKSTEFWGEETIEAFQLAERIELHSISGKPFEPVNLSGTPGLGHLRHTLLDERSYLWETRVDETMQSVIDAPDSYCVALRLSDPTAGRFTDRVVVLDLTGGWTGHAELSLAPGASIEPEKAREGEAESDSSKEIVGESVTPVVVDYRTDQRVQMIERGPSCASQVSRDACHCGAKTIRKSRKPNG